MRKKIRRKIEILNEIPGREYEPLQPSPADKAIIPEEKTMSIQERLGWVHRAAITLKSDDLTEVKFALKSLIAEANQALDAVRLELSGIRKQAHLAEAFERE